MNTVLRTFCLSLAALAYLALHADGLLAQALRNAVVPVPQVEGPLPATSQSAPFLRWDRNLEPFDLEKVRYVEEEFLIAGQANVYEWAADGTLSVRTPNASYGTRVLVRRPATASRFSGNVVVELMNSARRFDWPMMWGYSRDFFVANGDAWIGVTMPNGSIGLKAFDPTRYERVSFANPSPTPCTPGATRSNIEEGLRWDAVSQVAALLRSTVPARPLAGWRVEAVLLTTQGADLLTYINAIHPHFRLGSGRPVFDGYLSKSPAPAARIHQCGAAPPVGDPRRVIGPLDVPIIAVVAQGEVLESLQFRRPDSDTTGDRFRLYEVAGAGHIDKSAYAGFPSFAEQDAAVGTAQGTPEWPFTARCTPEIPLMASRAMSYVFNAAFQNLERWVRRADPAPRIARLSVTDAVVIDAHGIAIGGVRTPQMDVPASAYTTNSSGPGVCREMGQEKPYDDAKFRALYPSSRDYVNKISRSADALVKERTLTEADARRIKQEAREKKR